MSLTDYVKAFVFSHRRHGTVTADASPETATGYDLVIRCSCRAMFRVYVAAEWRPTTSWRRLNGTDANGLPPVGSPRARRVLPPTEVARVP
jgi:hypothetical protein